jgi:hypothetical protein
MRTAIETFVVFVFAAALALAADVTGTWRGQIEGPNGDKFDLSFNFKQDGSKVTGTSTNPHGDPVEISDGKVTGDQISFTVNIPVNGGMKVAHTGKIVSDSQIDMKFEFGDHESQSFTVKKQ